MYGLVFVANYITLHRLILHYITSYILLQITLYYITFRYTILHFNYIYNFVTFTLHYITSIFLFLARSYRQRFQRSAYSIEATSNGDQFKRSTATSASTTEKSTLFQMFQKAWPRNKLQMPVCFSRSYCYEILNC